MGFNARTLSAPQLRGWSRYTSNLCRELTGLGVQVYLLSDRELNPQWLKGFDRENLKVVVKKGKFYLHWEQIVLPQLCKSYGLDVLHCPINYGLPLFSSCPKILTLHDAIAEAFYNPDKSLGEKLSFNHNYLKALNALSQWSSDKVITVSHHAKRDLERYFGIPSEKIEVIHEAADPQFSQAPVRGREELHEKWGIRDPYFFYVGGLEDRKNISFLLNSYSEFSHHQAQLIIAGGGVEVSHYRERVEKMGLQNRVHFLGWVEEEELPSLYRYAKAFIYPSLYEGFGLQIVEAMSLGVPVIASGETSLPEILQNEEATFDPRDKESLKALMERIFGDEDFCQKLRDHSLKRSQDFSWKKTAEQTKALYQKLVSC